MSDFRCFGTGHPQYESYHDEEWGKPLRGEAELYEQITLEGFQSGLAWITVLRKRESFREAFAHFDAHKVASFTEDDVERLMNDAGIVRNRRKIEAAITNARAIVALHDAGETLTDLIWSFAPATHTQPKTFEDVPPQSADSVALAKALKKRGFVFVGPTTMYAMMQSCGLVNDHLEGCLAQ